MVPWKQSASLILLANKQLNKMNGKSLFDYSTLLLKRSPKMRFAPDISAWPGGRLDPCDVSSEWPEYLSSSMNIDRFSKKIADIYHDIDHPYPGLVFRLCAIRETFEETGILLAKSHTTSSNSQYSNVLHLPNHIINQWRDKIRHDGSQFIIMCKEMQVQPDVHSLHEWTQYLAAAIAKVRFDTIFYIAPLQKTYSCLIADDDHETVSAEWFEPDHAINAYHQNSLNFLPPQVYEFARLANFRKLSDLIEYLIKCENDREFHIKRMLGVCYKIPEGSMLVMLGDDYYPSDASFATPILSLNKTLKDFDSQNQNRLVMINQGDSRKWKIYYKNTNENKNTFLNINPLPDGWEKLEK